MHRHLEEVIASCAKQHGMVTALVIGVFKIKMATFILDACLKQYYSIRSTYCEYLINICKMSENVRKEGSNKNESQEISENVRGLKMALRNQ